MRYAIKYYFLVLAIYLLGSCTADESTGDTDKLIRNETMADILKRDLLVNYDKFTRALDFNNTTKIAVGFHIKHVDLNELKGTMRIYGWLSMIWTDKNLAWDPPAYAEITEMNLPGHEIWQPDLIAYNSASDGVDQYGNTLNVVKFNGVVIWVPPAQFDVFCELDFRMWPFDTQTCTLSIGSWSYGTNDIELESKTFVEADAERYVENHEWVIKDVKISKEQNDCCLKPFQSIRYDITLERRSPMYRTIVITPASCIIILTLSCFWLPAQSGEKILLNSINMVMIFAFMMYFAQMLPVLAVSTPLVVLFYSSSLILVSISMVISVLVLYLANTEHQRRAPELLRNILNGPVGTALCLFHLTPRRKVETQDKELQEESFENHTTEEDQPAIEESPKLSNQHDWLVIATAIDRIFFLIYCIVFIVLAACYSV